jgi:hypothetical protein
MLGRKAHRDRSIRRHFVGDIVPSEDIVIEVQFKRSGCLRIDRGNRLISGQRSFVILHP